ncbi:MAG: hypothetical protein PHR44_06860 [Candidatus Omnitrophica bacterium]|nr:hypothetical protein [Candidatus Omnitrophota bacterium]
MQKLIFVSKNSQVDRYLHSDLQDNGLAGRGILFIALSPAVYSYLKRLNIPAHNTLPYFTTESHKRVLDKSRALTGWLRENVKIAESEFGHQHACREAFVFLSRLRMHYSLKLIEIVYNAVDVHHPTVIAASLSEKKYYPDEMNSFPENYAGQIVKSVSQEKSLRFEEIGDYKDGSFARIKHNAKNLSRFLFRWFEFSLWSRKRLLENLLNNRSFILLTTKHYNMDKLAEKIKGEYGKNRLFFLNDPAIPDCCLPDFIIRMLNNKLRTIIKDQRKSFNELVKKINADSALFSYRGIMLGVFLAQDPRNNIMNYIIYLFVWLVRLNNFIKPAKPIAILSCGNRPDDVALAEMADSNNIPLIFISHGSHVQPKNDYEMIEWGEQGRMFLSAPFSLLALQTPLAEGYLKVFPSESKIIRSGPLIWGTPVDPAKSRALYEGMFSKKYDRKKTRIVLHAGTSKIYSRFYVYETGDEYLQSLVDLAASVEKIPDTVLIIRIRPSFEITLDTIKSIVPFSEKVILSTEGRFIDILGIADLLVSFSSTTIEEALQNRIPVLLYGGMGRYQHIPAYAIESGSHLPRRALYHVKESRDLEYAISNILNLSMDRERDSHLFDQYIYTENERQSIFDLINSYAKKQGYFS